MDRKNAHEFDQRALDLYDDYAHGRISRRDFTHRIAGIAAAGVTAESIIASLTPNYAWAQQIKPDDSRIVTERLEYASPKGGGKVSGLLAQPSEKGKKFPSVLVIHENRGLNPYIEDVARRLAVEGFLAFAPDALSPLGGYPGNDDEGRKMQANRKPEEMLEDFAAAAVVLQKHPNSNGKVGAVGFCYGGGVVNQLAIMLPDVINAGVPFYGRQPNPSDVSKINSPLLIQYAELDTRINDGWPAFERALKENQKSFEVHFYPKANHGFHNDSTPRYDEAAAKLAWSRTIEFFKKELKSNS